MVNQRLQPDFQLADGDGFERPFYEYLADFNILAIRRVPIPSHGPATKLLCSLLAENRGVQGVTVRGFDIRSPDRPCKTYQGPHIVFNGPDLTTICDSDSSILRQFGVVGYDWFLVVRTGPQVIGIGSIEKISRLGVNLGFDGTSSQHRTARAPPGSRCTGSCPTVFDGRN